jgi:hypothetical protein
MSETNISASRSSVQPRSWTHSTCDTECNPYWHQCPIQKVKPDIDPRRPMGIDIPRQQVLAKPPRALATFGIPELEACCKNQRELVADLW